MEKKRYFKIYNGSELMCIICAHTSFEAIDKAYYKYVSYSKNLERRKLTAKK
jgi:hypothetical protein